MDVLRSAILFAKREENENLVLACIEISLKVKRDPDRWVECDASHPISDFLDDRGYSMEQNYSFLYIQNRQPTYFHY